MIVDLNGKVSLVTGAANGIGRAIALTLARSGSDIIVTDIEQDAGQAVTNDIQALGAKAIFVKADVSSPQQMVRMAQEAVDACGKIDILINNAGIGVNKPEDRVPMYDFDEDLWDRLVSVNLSGAFYCSRAVAKTMIPRRYGKIVNIGSVMGLVPARMQCAYNATKAGLLNLTKAMALELAPYRINVNAIAPGSIVTRATNQKFYQNPEAADKVSSLLSHIPLGHPGQPQDVANAVLFMVSDASSYTTGAVLTVDGGWTCGFTRDW